MGSARQLASALGYTVGTFLLIPGSICFLAGTAKYQAGNDLYDIACSFLVLAALLDFVAAVQHVQQKVPDVIREDDEEHALLQNSRKRSSSGMMRPRTTKEILSDHTFLNSTAMLVGGILFLTASILSTYGESVASVWVFRFGSFSYMSGSSLSLHDLIVSAEESKKTGSVPLTTLFWMSVCVLYLIGALLFIAGGMVIEISETGAGASALWLAGSVFFFVGSGVMLALVVRSLLDVKVQSKAAHRHDGERVGENSQF